MPHAEHVWQWERRKEAQEARDDADRTVAAPGTQTRVVGPKAAAGSVPNAKCPDCGAWRCPACREDARLAAIHRGL